MFSCLRILVACFCSKSALFPSGTGSAEPEWPFNYQEKAEGAAESSGETGETEREKREGSSTQWETSSQYWLCVLRQQLRAAHKLHHKQNHEHRFYIRVLLVPWRSCHDVNSTNLPGVFLCRLRCQLWFLFILYHPASVLITVFLQYLN